MQQGVVHVIGAGMAGLAAAVRLAQNGHKGAGRKVALYDAAGQAGGRCRSYFDETLGCRLDNGNHLLVSGNTAAMAYIAATNAAATFQTADIAVFPWLRSWKNQGIDWNDYPHLKGWFDEIAARPAVLRGVEVLADRRKPITDDKAREMLFGKTQYQQR